MSESHEDQTAKRPLHPRKRSQMVTHPAVLLGMFLLKIPTTETLYRDHKAHHPGGQGKRGERGCSWGLLLLSGCFPEASQNTHPGGQPCPGGRQRCGFVRPALPGGREQKMHRGLGSRSWLWGGRAGQGSRQGREEGRAEGRQGPFARPPRAVLAVPEGCPEAQGGL